MTKADKAADLDALARFLSKEAAQFSTDDPRLKAAIKNGAAAEFLHANLKAHVRHQHPGPICASGHMDPSCRQFGEHALCTFGFDSSGYCTCMHYPKR